MSRPRYQASIIRLGQELKRWLAAPGPAAGGRDQGEEEIAAIWEVRHRISERFGHDPYRLVAYLMELQKEHPEKLVPAPETEVAGKTTAED